MLLCLLVVHFGVPSVFLNCNMYFGVITVLNGVMYVDVALGSLHHSCMYLNGLYGRDCPFEDKL